jgi:predicted transcriptional regulator
LAGAEERKRVRARERARIFYDILCSIIKQERLGDVARITRIQNEVNLPSDRFRQYLREMERLQLLKYGDTLASTERGKEFASEYDRVIDVLKRFGLA